MENSFKKLIEGYQAFRKKYVLSDNPVMHSLAYEGQKPQIMLVACCDSRVDPALLLQCDPGDLFVVRNVANIVPPYEKVGAYHGTSAALEFGVCYLNIKHLIILGHSQCGGIQALLNQDKLKQNDFITPWVSVIKTPEIHLGRQHPDEYAKRALTCSYENCLTFPWIHERVSKQMLTIHLWFFDIQKGEIFTYSHEQKQYCSLEENEVVPLKSK